MGRFGCSAAEEEDERRVSHSRDVARYVEVAVAKT
jgi:hypothetical protein